MPAAHNPEPANRDNTPRPNLGEKLRKAMLKPELPGTPGTWNEPLSVDELEVAVKNANDKERLIGFVAAPLAAIISILVIASLINNDAPALKNGRANPLHTSVGLYHELLIVLLAMSVLMLVLAMLRKRLLLGIVTALYGLGIFNLHFWGFGAPFVLAGAWYLVRAYRLQRSLREAGGGDSGSGFPRRPGAATSAPRANKRYTPPTASRRWSATKPAKGPGVN